MEKGKLHAKLKTEFSEALIWCMQNLEMQYGGRDRSLMHAKLGNAVCGGAVV